MFTENPNRGKRRASSASRRTIRTSVPRSARTTSGEPIASGVTVYRVDPAHLRRVGAERAVASCERAAAGKRAAAGSVVLARGVRRRADLPGMIERRTAQLAAILGVEMPSYEEANERNLARARTLIAAQLAAEQD